MHLRRKICAAVAALVMAAGLVGAMPQPAAAHHQQHCTTITRTYVQQVYVGDRLYRGRMVPVYEQRTITHSAQVCATLMHMTTNPGGLPPNQYRDYVPGIGTYRMPGQGAG